MAEAAAPVLDAAEAAAPVTDPLAPETAMSEEAEKVDGASASVEGDVRPGEERGIWTNRQIQRRQLR